MTLLAALDREFAAAYQKMYASFPHSEQTTLASVQTAWLAQRNACRTDKTCIRDAYLTRLSQLGGRAPANGTNVLPGECGRATGGDLLPAVHRSFNGDLSAVQCEQCMRTDHLRNSSRLRHDRIVRAGFLRGVQVAASSYWDIDLGRISPSRFSSGPLRRRRGRHAILAGRSLLAHRHRMLEAFAHAIERDAQ